MKMIKLTGEEAQAYRENRLKQIRLAVEDPQKMHAAMTMYTQAEVDSLAPHCAGENVLLMEPHKLTHGQEVNEWGHIGFASAVVVGVELKNIMDITKDDFYLEGGSSDSLEIYGEQPLPQDWYEFYKQRWNNIHPKHLFDNDRWTWVVKIEHNEVEDYPLLLSEKQLNDMSMMEGLVNDKGLKRDNWTNDDVIAILKYEDTIEDAVNRFHDFQRSIDDTGAMAYSTKEKAVYHVGEMPSR